jgi:hypothetical protein
VIDPAIGSATEKQLCFGLAGALEAGPVVARIAASQIGKVNVDGVGVDIDEAGRDGQLSGDGRLRATVGWVGPSRLSNVTP